MTQPRFSSLAALNAALDECTHCATVARGFRHVPGGGAEHRPDAMFVFINPTFRNITAHAAWPGRRFPFAARPKLWQILAETGWVDPEIPQRITEIGPSPALVELLAREAHDRRIYLTNTVKCVDDGSNLPAAERVSASWPVLHDEIALVQPRMIVGVGLIPFRALTGMQIRLSDELWSAQHGTPNAYPSRPIGGVVYPVYPCYFPTGRGNPVAATIMLRALRHVDPQEPGDEASHT